MHTTPSAVTINPVTPNPVAEAVVDLDAITNNIGVLREHAGSAAVMAVVKADAYGHGVTAVARTAVAAGAAELGVASIDEALKLRRDGISAPILAWLHPPGTDFTPALQADVQIAVSSVRQLSELVDAVHRSGVTASVTVKIDTGLNRNGVSLDDYPEMLDALLKVQAAEAIQVRGLMSHMACSDDPDHPANNVQAQRFTDALTLARRRGLRYGVAHLANSAGAMSGSDLAFDMVRPGIAVYGLSPIPGRGRMGLIPAMTVRCPVALVKSVPAGAGVSYGHTWVADRDTTVALLPIGYADGVFRGLGGRMDVLINGRRRRSVGRICMDQFAVEVGPGEAGVSEGDVAILFGPGTNGESTAQEWAETLGTIHYEVVTSPRGRIARVYTGGAKH